MILEAFEGKQISLAVQTLLLFPVLLLFFLLIFLEPVSFINHYYTEPS